MTRSVENVTSGVAIKVLPAAFTGDPEPLARFEREARLLAALNHPRIAAIYSVGRPECARPRARIDLTLKKEGTKPAAANVMQQQARFDAFVDWHNQERPHQAWG